MRGFERKRLVTGASWRKGKCQQVGGTASASQPSSCSCRSASSERKIALDKKCFPQIHLSSPHLRYLTAVHKQPSFCRRARCRVTAGPSFPHTRCSSHGDGTRLRKKPRRSDAFTKNCITLVFSCSHDEAAPLLITDQGSFRNLDEPTLLRCFDLFHQLVSQPFKQQDKHGDHIEQRSTS